MTDYAIKKSYQDGHYDIYADNRFVGEVFKTVTHYNIAPKPIKVTSWRFSINGQPRVATTYGTRRAALAEATSRLEALARAEQHA